MDQSLINTLQNLSSHKTLGNIFKAANQFMDNHEVELKTNIEIVLKHYQCYNDVDKLIRIRLIDRFKCYDEILNLLKSEDLFYISQALQCSWFFENSKFDPHLLVDCDLPLMSYTTRFKVLKKYSKSLKNPEVAVTFFSCLKQRYGLNTALILLPACDQSFIEHILINNSMQIHVSVILSLLQDYPSVIVNYFSYLLENASAKKRIYRIFNFSYYEKVFILLAKKQPQQFSALMEKYHHLIPYMKLGKRSTKQFVKIAFDSIKKNGQIYKRILNWKFVIPCLNLEQISELQFNFLPRTVNDFFKNYHQYSDFVRVVSSLKESVRNEIFISNFNRAYNKPVTDYLNVINLDSVHLLPTEDKERWVESKLPTLDSPCDKARHVVHLPISKSLPLLKKMVEVQADVDVRILILKSMFKTVVSSNSQELIKDMCSYVLHRFRNDKYVIREGLILELTKYKHLVELSEDCWEVIEEIINMNILENEVSSNINMALIVEVIKIRIYSRLLRDLPTDNYFEKLLKISDDNSTFDLCRGTPYEKHCLKWFLDNLPEKKLNKNKEENDQTMQENSEIMESMLKYLCQWNAYHSDDRINFPDWLNNWITWLFETEESQYRKQSVLEIVKKDVPLKYAFYRKIVHNFISPHILIYNLHQDPELILNHAEKIIAKILSEPIKPYHTFFKQCRLYPAFNLSNIISEYCIKILTEKCEDSEHSMINERKKSIEILSVTVDTMKFVEIIKDFYPVNTCIDDYSDEGRELFQLQSEISGCLKYVNTPSEVLGTLRKFAVGDYLRLVVGSLNSISLRTPENKILKLLKEWFDCPVSLRKHFFRSYFRIAPVLNTMEIIIGLFESEKNMTLRVILFNHALRLFQKEPSSETFMVLKAISEKLNSTDDTSITKLLAIENVPNEFVSEYLKLLWNVINQNIQNECLLKDYQSKIIALIEPDILQLLSEDFCDVLIKEAFMQKSLEFVSNYLLYCENSEQVTSRYNKITPYLNQLLMKWNEFDLKSDIVFKNRRAISLFIESLVRKTINWGRHKLFAYQAIIKVRAALTQSLEEYDIFEELLLIQLSEFFFVSQFNIHAMLPLKEYVEILVDKAVNAYGAAPLDAMCSVIKKVILWKFSNNADFSLDNYLISFSELLCSSSSNYCFILGLKILPTVINSDIKKYENLLTLCFQKNVSEVRFYVNKLFHELYSNVVVE